METPRFEEQVSKFCSSQLSNSILGEFVNPTLAKSKSNNLP